MLEIIRKKFLRNIQIYDIDMEELLRKQENGAIIIDVRSTQEYNEGHIKGAINIPYYEISKNIRYVIPNLLTEIVVYCGIGARSKRAYKILKKLQYHNVYNLYGGIENWQ